MGDLNYWQDAGKEATDTSALDTGALDNTRFSDTSIGIVVFDDVDSLSVTTSSDASFKPSNFANLSVTDNKITINGLNAGNYTFTYITKSGGTVDDAFAVSSRVGSTNIEFNKIDVTLTVIRTDTEESDNVTFVTGDDITFEASLSGQIILTDNYPKIQWVVEDMLTGEEPSIIVLANGVDFHFIPAPVNRPISGSKFPNPPIQFKITVSINGLTCFIHLKQDNIDILRQEYIDYDTSWKPERENIVEYKVFDPPFNSGNYNYIALQTGSNDYQTVLDNILFSWTDEQGSNAPAIAVTSGFRNPQRNRAAGSVANDSYHTRGRAIDIKFIDRQYFTKEWWQKLRQACRDVPYPMSHCDQSGTWVDTDKTGEHCEKANHIHIQW